MSSSYTISLVEESPLSEKIFRKILNIDRNPAWGCGFLWIGAISGISVIGGISAIFFYFTYNTYYTYFFYFSYLTYLSVFFVYLQ